MYGTNDQTKHTPIATLLSYQRGRLFIHHYPKGHITALVGASRDLGDWTVHIPNGKRIACRTYQHPQEGTFYRPREAKA